VLRPAIRGLLGMALVWVPAGIWLIETADLDALAGGAWLGDPVLWLLLLAGVAWAPAALTVASVTTSTLAVLDPRLPISMARRLGGDYALLVGAALLAALGDVLAGLAAGLVRALPLPVLAGVTAKALTLWAPLAFARAAGLLIHTRGDELGYGLPGDYLEPVLGAVAPRGSPPPPPLAPEDPPHRLEAIELEPGAPAAPAEAPPAADPAALFEQARGAAAAGRYAEAAELLREAAAREEHPVAAAAWLVLGRLYRGKLGHPEAGREALEYLVARWPDGEPARQARALLAAP
jgi:tetratricopeptide (TPR) repeat protein